MNKCRDGAIIHLCAEGLLSGAEALGISTGTPDDILLSICGELRGGEPVR